MIEIFTAAAVGLAWFVFRYDRYGKQRDAVEAAYGLLRAVKHGMLSSGETEGWGMIYFATAYSEQTAQERAATTYLAVKKRALDQVFVVPTEPLARLATSAPHDGLLDSTTVGVANFVLWRLHVFNQLVLQLANFNARHAAEILSKDTTAARREELASAAASLSRLLHESGIGDASWFAALVAAIQANTDALHAKRTRPLRERLVELPYSVVDLLVLAGFTIVLVSVVS